MVILKPHQAVVRGNHAPIAVGTRTAPVHRNPPILLDYERYGPRYLTPSIDVPPHSYRGYKVVAAAAAAPVAVAPEVRWQGYTITHPSLLSQHGSQARHFVDLRNHQTC